RRAPGVHFSRQALRPAGSCRGRRGALPPASGGRCPTLALSWRRCKFWHYFRRPLALNRVAAGAQRNPAPAIPNARRGAFLANPFSLCRKGCTPMKRSLTKLLSGPRQGARKAQGFRPRVESLETRLAPVIGLSVGPTTLSSAKLLFDGRVDDHYTVLRSD